MIRHTQKVILSLDKTAIKALDELVRTGRYPNRSQAVQAALDLLAERQKRSRLTRELAKLDRRQEQEMAEQDLGAAPWPRF